MFDKQTLTPDMIVAFLKDANVVGAGADSTTNIVTLYVDEDSPNVTFDLTPMLSKLVAKVAGKELSTNDFTDALLNRLNAIQDQVQSNWDENDIAHIEYIRNKPNVYLPTQAVRDILDELTVVDGELLYSNEPIDSVIADWDETNPTHKTYIANKPVLYDPSNKDVLDELTVVDDLLFYNGVAVQSSLVAPDWDETDHTKIWFIRNKPNVYLPTQAVRDVLDLVSEVDGNMLYNGLPIDSATPDWDVTDILSKSYIANKPDVYLPSTALRSVLNSFTSVGGLLTWGGNIVAMKTDTITSIKRSGLYGIPIDFTIT